MQQWVSSLSLIFSLATLVVLPAVNTFAQDIEPSEAALAELIKNIEEIQSAITARRSERDSVFASLQASEKNLATLAAEISTLESAINQNETQLTSLNTESRGLQERKASQQELLGQYIRSSYQSGRQEYFKLLLNQESPAQAARTIRYYSYFHEARNSKVKEYNETLDQLSLVEESITQKIAQLNTQRETLATQKTALEDEVQQREIILDELDVFLSSSSKKLEALEAERVEMELLIEEIRRSIADLSLGGQQELFSSRKGNLLWPVDGDLENRWGSSYGLGDLNWQGITISANQGAQVRAVHHGRVVFSDWFSSSGLLLIIDHGGGYMSLYAHNQELFREVGEWVNSGEIIASVGNTGGQEDYGLYFEIRHDGESENPSGWLTARN